MRSQLTPEGTSLPPHPLLPCRTMGQKTGTGATTQTLDVFRSPESLIMARIELMTHPRIAIVFCEQIHSWSRPVRFEHFWEE